MEHWMFIYASNNQIWGVLTNNFYEYWLYLSGAYIIRFALGLYDNLLLIYRRALPAEASVGICLIE